MPNWCYSNYRFYADTENGKEQLKVFYEKLEKAVSHNTKKLFITDFGDDWLGHVIQAFCPQFLEVTTETVICNYEGNRIPFRGSINILAYDIDNDEGSDEAEESIEVGTETAWGPMPEMWDMILKECGYTDIRYVYEAEECGNALYINTDTEGRFFLDRYYIEANVSEYLYDYYSDYLISKSELLDTLNKMIVDLRNEYKMHPERNNLPDEYSPTKLRKQRTVEKAIAMLTKNLFSSEDNDRYLRVHEFTA